MYFFSQCREQIKYESMVKLGVPHPKYHVLLRQSVVSRETIFKIKCLFVRVLSFFFCIFFSNSVAYQYLYFDFYEICSSFPLFPREAQTEKQAFLRKCWTSSVGSSRGTNRTFSNGTKLSLNEEHRKKREKLDKKNFPESRRVNVKCIFSIFSFFHLTSNELVCSLQEMFLKQCQYSRLASAAIPVEKIYWIDQSDARLPETRLSIRTWCM